MSRFIVSKGSYFDPFTYDELAKPVQQSAEAHAATADAYEQLSMQTEALGRYISENEGDTQAKALYDNYINKLNTLQENLWNNGYSASARRDLSSARAAYANDITRLQSAIQSRQERSKEYWDAKHKNPELIMGYDPGSSGLDNYLNDSEYGRDWYSYNGMDFANQVGAEAKARAAELVSAYATKNPQLAGYIEYHIKNGFTNAQVNNAGILAQRMLAGQVSPDDPNIDPIEGLLANTLISRLQSTGAMPGQNLSAGEYSRLFNYGMLGLSQGVGTEKIDTINDKVWDEASKKRIAAFNHSLSSKQQPTQEPVHRELINRPIASENVGKVAKKVSSYFDDETYADGKTVMVNLPDGSGKVLHNADEARQLFSTEKAEKFFNATGMDVRTAGSDWWKTTESKQTGSYQGIPLVAEKAGPFQVMFHKNVKPGDVIVKKKVNGKWQYDAQMTSNWNAAKDDYDNWMNRISEANPGLNLSKVGATPDEIRDLRKEGNIPSGVADYDVRTAYESQVQLGNAYGVPIIGGPEDDDLRKRIALEINGRYSNTRGPKDWEHSPNGFYQVKPGNIGSAKDSSAGGKGKGLKDVFTLDTNGNIEPSSIYHIYVMPQDINGGKTKVRLETSKGTFITDISTLGDDLDGAMNSAVSQALEILMTPLNDVVKVLDQNDTTGNGWDAIAYPMLYGYNAPIIKVPGGYAMATAQEVARNPQLQKALLDGINEYIQDAIAFGIDPISLRPRQHVGYTSTKAEGMVE